MQKKIKYTYKITLTLIAILAAVPLGVSLAAAPTDSQFKTKAEEMRTAHQAFKEARSQAATPEVANENANTNRGQIKEQILERQETRRKITLQKIVDLQIAYFERVQKRVDTMPNISETEKTKLTAEITATRTGLIAKKTEIDAATGTDALKTLAKDLRTTFMGYHEIVKAIVNAIHASKVSDAENTSANRAAAIEAKLDELATAGKDVSALKTELATAQTYIDDAKTLRVAGDNAGAVAKLQDAYAIFKTVSQSVKNL